MSRVTECRIIERHDGTCTFTVTWPNGGKHIEDAGSYTDAAKRIEKLMTSSVFVDRRTG